ncbi:MAG: hypothetical protein ACI8ZF_000055 [Candidatus Midichloriaceae bacterium]|jgi:membrane protein implicated in regulation of membrane protease activity
MEYFLNNLIEVWFILGTLLMVIEMFLGGTIMLFFAGLASFTVAVILRFDLIQLPSFIEQVGAFFGALCIWSIILWKPAKYLSYISKYKNYDSMIGREAIVVSERIDKEHIGEVRWSGSLFRAKLSKKSKSEYVNKEEVLKILDVKNNILIMDR